MTSTALFAPHPPLTLRSRAQRRVSKACPDPRTWSGDREGVMAIPGSSPGTAMTIGVRSTIGNESDRQLTRWEREFFSSPIPFIAKRASPGSPSFSDFRDEMEFLQIFTSDEAKKLWRPPSGFVYPLLRPGPRGASNQENRRLVDHEHLAGPHSTADMACAG